MQFFYTALRHLARQDNQQKAPKKAKDAKGSSKDIALDLGITIVKEHISVSAQLSLVTFTWIYQYLSNRLNDVGCSCFSRVLERRKAAELNIFRHGPFFGEIESEYIVSCR